METAEEIRSRYSRLWFNEEDDIDDPKTGFIAWPDVLEAIKYAQSHPEAREISDELSDYILKIDFMTTVEFCKEFGVPLPRYTGNVQSSADQFLQIDAIKHKMFVEKAKELKRNKLK